MGRERHGCVAGACRLMADFQKRFVPESTIYISVPTWANHHNIWRDAGVQQATYRYYKPETRGLDFEGLIEDIKVFRDGNMAAVPLSNILTASVFPGSPEWKCLLASCMCSQPHGTVQHLRMKCSDAMYSCLNSLANDKISFDDRV